MSNVRNDLRLGMPDSLAPLEIEAKVEEVGVGKVGMAVSKVLVLAVLAGAFIAFGGMYFCIFLGDATMPFAVQRAVGGLCFCLGLVLVLCCGAELFTGNSLIICAKASGKVGWAAMLKNWALVWLGNLAGALLAVALIYLAQVWSMNGGAVGEAMVSVAAGKVSPAWMTLFFKGIILPISAFVAAGFEHCVANMFFLPMGCLLSSMGVGAPGAVPFESILYNLSAATLGNIVGGLLVGLAYWFVFGQKKTSK